MGDNETQKNWWATLPGIITAIAALITATGGLILALDKAGMLRPSTTPTTVSSALQEAGRSEGNTPGNGKPAGELPPPDASKYQLATIDKYAYSFPYPKDLLLPVTSTVAPPFEC